MTNLMKKWKKLIAGIVLCAFFFQAGPIYAFDLLAVDAPAAPITAEAEEESYSDEGELSLAAENAEPEEAETTSIPEEPNLPGIDLFEQSKNSVNSNLDINALQDGGVTVNNETEIDGELEDMREPSVKYFLNEDNSITASTYAHPVHYLDEETGRYRDIDNSLMASTDAELNNVLVNTDNAFRVKFARKAKENKLVKLDLSGYHISWGMEASNKDSELTLIEKEAEFLSANDPKELEDVTSAVVYPNIQENVDLRYDLIGTDLKENIILNTPSAPASFSFVYSTNELKMVQNEDGISLRTPQDEVLCFLKPLIMIDSDQAESTAIDVTLTTISDKSNNHQYRLTMTPSAQWLSSADRVYPVTIDPGISLGGDSSDSTYAITGTFVNEGAPTTVYTAPNYMWIGTNQPDRYAILIKSALPSAIKESDRVVNAQLVLTPYGSTFTDLETAGAPAIEAHEIKSSWESGSVTWNTKPSCDSRILDYDRAKTVNGVSPNNKYYTWDITQTVDKWFMENTCYGIMLKTPDNFMREYARASFWSSANTADKPSRPVIDITYINMVGLEDYWTYHSQNAGLAGNGYVNDFTGNLTTVFEDFTVPGERMPLTVNHSYSSYKCGEAQPTLNVGHGYRLNIQETVEKVTIGGATKYRYTDGDGTEHYFEKNSSGKWVDDSGLDLTLTVGTSEYTITDKKDNKRVFSVSKNYLLRIEDNDGNKITLNYDSNGWLLSVSDDSGKYAGATNRTITFERYSGTNLLQYMKYNGRTITYSYTDYNDGYGLKNCLTQVVFPGGSSLQGSSTGGSNVARFAYTTSGSLTDLIDATQNVGIHYEYSWVYGMRRIGAYSVCTYNGTTPTAKNRYTISYDQYHNTYTEVNPNEGRSENFYFNNMGQTVSAQDQDGNALYSEMGMSGGAKNKVTFASKAQQTITNLLKNHSFEGNFSSNYSTFGAAANISVVSSSSEYPSLFGNKLLKIQSTSAGETGVSQTVTVKGGQTYTFSAYFRTTFDAGFIRLSSSYGTAEETGIQQLNSYKRYDVTLDLTSVPSTQDVVLTASVGASPENWEDVLVDGLQLETGECANRYNLMENGDFESPAGSTWSFTNQNYGNQGVYDARRDNSPYAHSGSCEMMFTGSPLHAKNVYQTVPVSGKKGEGFVYGVWVKSDAVPNKATKDDKTKQAVSMTLDFVPTSGTSKGAMILLPATPDEWTYVCGEAIADVDFSAVKVSLNVNYAANTIFFDDVQVYKDVFGESFLYDAKGNIVTVTDMAKNTQNIATNGNNDMTGYKDGKGNAYSFVYDGGSTTAKKHNLTKTTAPDGTYTNMAYYDNGLLHYVSVYGSTGSAAIRTEKIYDTGQNYLKTSKDQLQKTTSYAYNANSGLLNSVSEPYGSGSSVTTNYSYNTPTQKLRSVTKDGLTVGYDYSAGRMSAINITDSSATTSYGLNYNALGRLSSVTRSSNGGAAVTLESYTYDEARGNQTGVTYGNGKCENYIYDAQNRLVGTSDGEKTVSELFYNSNGLLGKSYSYDDPNDTTWNKYQYDFAERYVGTQSSEGYGIGEITYDKNDNLTGYASSLHRGRCSLKYITTHNYNNVDNLIGSVYRYDSDGDSGIIAKEYRSYDNAGRLNCTRAYTTTTDGTETVGDGFWVSYTYLDPLSGENTTDSSTHTTNLVREMRMRYTSKANTAEALDVVHKFSYDDAANIKSINTTLKNGTSYTTSYTYDSRGQLTKANNVDNSGKYYAYTYDKRGNITGSTYQTASVITNKNSYHYNNANSPDELSVVDMKKGSVATSRKYEYDTIGNPTGIVDTTGNVTTGKRLSWEQGKNLRTVEFTENDNVVKSSTYYYDESDQLKKVVKSNGSYIKYHYDSGNLEYEEHYAANNELSYVLKYLYDDQGKVIYCINKDLYFNDDSCFYNMYHYLYNGLGEVTDIYKVWQYSEFGAMARVQEHVAHYAYDPYGNILSVQTYGNDDFGKINPIRYKGYYYDTELGWYNLGSRYYDPSVGRFINCDDISLLTETGGDITDKNLYSYCDNNPVMRKDEDGEFWGVVAVCAVASAALEIASQVIQDGEVTSWKSVGVSFLSGGLSVLPGGALISGIGTFAAEMIKGTSTKDALLQAGVSAGLSKIGGKALGFGRNAINNKTTIVKAVKNLNKIFPAKKNIQKSINRFSKIVRKKYSFNERIHRIIAGTRGSVWSFGVNTGYSLHRRGR